MDERIARATSQMGRRLDDPLPIATLAAGVHLSPSRFAHLFRRHVGTSPAQYLHALRMERARLMLEQTFLSVKEVMGLVGCNDASHFSRNFRRFHGITPRACRVAATATATSTAGLANEQQDAPREPPSCRPAPDVRWEERCRRQIESTYSTEGAQ